MKQKQTRREKSIDNSAVILGDLHIPFSIMEQSVKQNFSKGTEGLKNSVNLAKCSAGVCRSLPEAATQTFSSEVRMEHSLAYTVDGV